MRFQIMAYVNASALVVSLFHCYPAHGQQKGLTPCVANLLQEGLSSPATQGELSNRALAEQDYPRRRAKPSVASVMSIPSTPEEYSGIFEGAKPTPKQYETLVQRREALLKAGVVDVKDVGEKSYLCNLERFFSNSDTGFVAIIGHNDQGRFVFANGQTASLVYISDLARKHNKRLIVLSCGAKKYLPGDIAPALSITYDDALRLLAEFDGVLKAVPEEKGISINEAASYYEKIIRKKEWRKKVKYLVSGTAATSAVVGIVVTVESPLPTKTKAKTITPLKK